MVRRANAAALPAGVDGFDQLDHEAVAWGDLAFDQQYLAHLVNC